MIKFKHIQASLMAIMFIASQVIGAETDNKTLTLSDKSIVSYKTEFYKNSPSTPKTISLYLEHEGKLTNFETFQYNDGPPQIDVLEDYTYENDENVLIRVFWDANDWRFNDDKVFVYHYENGELKPNPIFKNAQLLDFSTNRISINLIKPYLNLTYFLHKYDQKQTIKKCIYDPYIRCITEKEGQYFFTFFDSINNEMQTTLNLTDLFKAGFEPALSHDAVSPDAILLDYSNMLYVISFISTNNLLNVSKVSFSVYCGNQQKGLYLEKVNTTSGGTFLEQLTSAKNGLKLRDPQDCKLSSEKAFFYEQPDVNTKSKKYIIKGDSVLISDFKNDFFFGTFTNQSGKTTTGWLRLDDIIEKSLDDTHK